jgi:hypothetical protein
MRKYWTVAAIALEHWTFADVALNIGINITKTPLRHQTESQLSAASAAPRQSCSGFDSLRAQSESVQLFARIGAIIDWDEMELDWQVCSRARLTRDARFDGKFFDWCVHQRSLLPLHLSCSSGEGEECSLLSDRRRRRGGRLSPLLALSSRMLTWNSSVVGDSKYSFARLAPD